MKRVLVAFLLFAVTSALSAEDPKLSIAPTGRVVMDGAGYISHDDQFESGAAITEARLGAKATYGIYSAKAEIGVAYGKVTLKDLYIETRFRPDLKLRTGYMLLQYGLQSVYFAANKSTMEMPSSNVAFDLPRAIGVMGMWERGDWAAAVAVTAESKSSLLHTNEMGKTSWGGVGRFVWRPVRIDGKIFQIGLSGAIMSPEYNADPELNHRSFSITAKYPTSVASVSALSAVVDDACSEFKFTPELLASYGRIALESQYYYTQISRHNAIPTYRAYGAYAILRGLIFGESCYSYYSPDSRLVTPSSRTLELALGYNYTCLSNEKAAIYGGRISDVSCTLNWYINRYMTWRLRYSYTHSWDRAGMDPVDLGTFQTRIQFVF